MKAGVLAGVGLILIENSAMKVSRSRRQIGHARNDELFLCRQAGGELAVEQNSREAVLEPGDLTLLDPSVPFSGRFSSDSKLLVLKVPRRSIEARVGATREMISRPIKPSDAENSLTSAFLGMLPAYTEKMGPAADESIKNQTLDLVAISLSKAMEAATPTLSSARSLALVKIRAAIEARLSDPSLDSKAVAAAARISVRYANAILAHEGTSIGRLIQKRRLARCRTALEDPSQAHRTVSDIAYGWGFSDMTHFGRRFRAAYGMLPTEYRQLAKKGK